MIKRFKVQLLLILSFGFILAFVQPTESPVWGFFGHKRINRLAVFTLPQNLFGFFKDNIEYVTDHAVDPDKRRYATKFEAIRHYIDIDHWGEYPYENVPRDYTEAILRYSTFFLVDDKKDTLDVFGPSATGWDTGDLLYTSKESGAEFKYNYSQLLFLFDEFVYGPQAYEDEWFVDKKVFESNLGVNIRSKVEKIQVVDHFSEYGIVPYYLLVMKNRLTKAFEQKDVGKILRLSADFGHYIGDAHVPLHTTENYNGQLTNQVGIHAFWESRLPELFADKEWDFLVGGAQYIPEPKEYFWDIVLTSSQLVDSVLNIERRLSLEFPVDNQYCFADRNGRNVRTQCEAYCRAFDEAMGGMVEERMQSSILSIGSIWYTCWVDGGRPNLENLKDVAVQIAKDSIPVSRPKPGDRVHDN